MERWIQLPEPGSAHAWRRSKEMRSQDNARGLKRAAMCFRAEVPSLWILGVQLIQAGQRRMAYPVTKHVLIHIFAL